MPVNDALGKRMKDFYEEIPKNRLMRRCPVVIRVDGRSFHSYAKGFDKPFDVILIKTMQRMMQYLCEHIQGCVLGYTQSDECSLLLIDYKTLNTQAFFDYEVQKVCSIAASIATMSFNKAYTEEVYNWLNNFFIDNEGKLPSDSLNYEADRFANRYLPKAGEAMFDARCFNIPKEEVTNYFYWRQLDATRNSIQMVGQANFSHSQLHKKSCNEIQDMLFEEYKINWNDYPTTLKRGSCCIKQEYQADGAMRTKWMIDNDIPIFKGDGREYIESLVNVGE